MCLGLFFALRFSLAYPLANGRTNERNEPMSCMFLLFFLDILEFGSSLLRLRCRTPASFFLLVLCLFFFFFWFWFLFFVYHPARVLSHNITSNIRPSVHPIRACMVFFYHYNIVNHHWYRTQHMVLFVNYIAPCRLLS